MTLEGINDSPKNLPGANEDFKSYAEKLNRTFPDRTTTVEEKKQAIAAKEKIMSHPDCPKGTELFYMLLDQRLTLLSEFAGKFYPLTQISMITGHYDKDQYGWSEGPMPWEGACI